ncbi:hypothetical protein [Pandoraea apista]|uniref:hypothetical protein n=1 Tax=Pandoraea apista TaxID=93218 RepID=UPI0006599AAD|nr:hypothetical protein [Pandoraea apista]ALS64909.1 hypothetical protein AT395_07865 [Pandoraea apista]CFB65272.1 hypothetical protein LMG16407_04776 [Pandoraea apista]
MKGLAFELGDAVALTMSKEAGFVIGRAEYESTADQYFVRYVTTDGRQVRDWFGAEELVKQ